MKNIQAQRTKSNLICALGEISAMYYLVDGCYVPARMIDRIDKVTSSLMENGFYQFYASKIDFEQKLGMRSIRMEYNINDDDDDLEPLLFEQMRIPLSFLFCMAGISVVVLIGEILHSKWRKRRLLRKNPIFLIFLQKIQP